MNNENFERFAAKELEPCRTKVRWAGGRTSPAEFVEELRGRLIG